MEIENSLCDLCINFYNHTMRFTCYHKYCGKCIPKVIICNINTLNSVNDINFEIKYKCVICDYGELVITNQKIIEFIDLKSLNNFGQQNDRCNSHKKIYKVVCLTCDVKMCSLCLVYHPDNHEISGIKLSSAGKNMKNICLNHKMEFKFLCISCNMKVCQSCKELSHEDSHHTLRDINEFYKEPIIKLKNITMPFNSAKVESFIDRFHKEECLAEENIKNYFSEIKNEISNLIASLNDINNLFDEKSENLIHDFKKYNMFIQQVFVNYYEYLQQISDNDNDFQILDLINKLPNFNDDRIKFIQKIEKKKLEESFNTIKNEISKIKEETKNMQIHTQICDNKKIKTLKVPSNENLNILIQTNKFRCISTLECHSNWIWSICSLNNNLIASASVDKTIKIWDSNQQNTCIAILEGHTDAVRSIIQLKNGLIASGSWDNKIKIWDPNQQYSCIATISGHTHYVYCLIQLNNDLLASSSADESIKIWDPDQHYKCIATLTGHTHYVYSITQLYTGLIVSGSHDKTLKIWNPYQQYQCITTLKGHSSSVNTVIRLTNDLIASGSSDNCIKIWEQFNCIFTLNGHDDSIISLVQLQYGLIASGSSDKSIKIWDPYQQYKCIRTLIGHNSSISAIIQLDNGIIASVSLDKNLKFWG